MCFVRPTAVCCGPYFRPVGGGLHPQLLHDTKKDTSRTPTLPTGSILGRAWPTVTGYDQSMPGGTAYAPAIHAHRISVLLLEASASRPANVGACGKSTDCHGHAVSQLKQ